MTVLQTPVNGFPYPDLNENADVPSDIQALAMALDPMGFVPVGAVMMWIATAAPTGWLILNGQVVSAATYPKLAQMFGQSGDNVTLPDMRDVFPVGASAANAVNARGGAASVTLTDQQSGLAAHNHGAKTALSDRSLAHTHPAAGQLVQPRTNGYIGNNYNPYSGNPGYNAVDGWFVQDASIWGISAGSASSPDHQHGITTEPARNAAQAHENRPPFCAVNFIIRAG